MILGQQIRSMVGTIHVVAGAGLGGGWTLAAARCVVEWALVVALVVNQEMEGN